MSDYYQGVVAEYLRNDRWVFVNPEALIQLDPGSLMKNRHWYCDLVAVSLKTKEVFLCEVTYSSSLQALFDRLDAWNANWTDLKKAVQRDFFIDPAWNVSPWVFLPESLRPLFNQKIEKRGCFGPTSMLRPKVTVLEDVVPWKIKP